MITVVGLVGGCVVTVCVILVVVFGVGGCVFDRVEGKQREG